MSDQSDPITSSEVQDAFRELRELSERFASKRIDLANAKARHEYEQRYGFGVLADVNFAAAQVVDCEEALIRLEAELRIAGQRADRAASKARMSEILSRSIVGMSSTDTPARSLTGILPNRSILSRQDSFPSRPLPKPNKDRLNENSELSPLSQLFENSLDKKRS